MSDFETVPTSKSARVRQVKSQLAKVNAHLVSLDGKDPRYPGLRVMQFALRQEVANLKRADYDWNTTAIEYPTGPEPF